MRVAKVVGDVLRMPNILTILFAPAKLLPRRVDDARRTTVPRRSGRRDGIRASEALRSALPMNLRAHFRGFRHWSRAASDDIGADSR